MGGIILTGSIPKLDFLTGAATICAPVDMEKSVAEMGRHLNNLYQHSLGKSVWEILLDNKEMMQTEIQEKAGYDIAEKIAELKRTNTCTVSQFDDLVISPLFGYRDRNHYYQLTSPLERLHDVHIPLLWLMAENDPFIGMEFGRDAFKQNPMIALATTSQGGHVAARHSICGKHIWFIDPVVKYFSAMLD